MTSPLLALFSRSLREDARQRRTYAARAGVVAIIALLMVVSIRASGSGGAPGLQFFAALAHLQSLCITLAGLSYFASAITEEKEEGMLGLLRMTELNPLSILLGKSTSRLCGALLLLAVQFPFTLLAVALGGVSVRQIAAAYLALGAYTIFLCNLALLASVVSRRTAHAAAWVAAVLAAFWLASWLFIHVTGSANFSGGLPLITALGAGITALSTSARLDAVLGTGFDGVLFGPQFAGNAGAGLLCFLAAWLVFDRACERGSAEAAGAAGQWLRRRNPPGRAWPRPLVWKDVWFMHGGRGVAVLKFAGYGAALAILFGAHFLVGGFWTSTAKDALSAAAWLSLIVFLLELGFAASRMYRLEVQARTFSSLLLLPCTVNELHSAKVHSCYQAVLPIGVWAVPCLAGRFMAAWGEGAAYTLLVFVPGFTVVILYVLPQVMLYFNLIIWLSLTVRRGALPLAIAAMLAGNFLALLGGFITLGLGLIPVPIVAVALARVLRDMVLARLDELAGEG
ncbi:MAG: hypothetical protein M3463_08435 [Verrucomicrobiota bacterium]|nr:hypothetical protein [Verrucomicrobiota bacterium]